MLACCGSVDTENRQGSAFDDHRTGSMELLYAHQFHVDFYDDGISVIEIEDGLKYLVTEDPEALPEWLPENISEDMTIISAPASSVYNAASSAMDLIDAIGAIDSVIMTSIQVGDWRNNKIREIVEIDKISYIETYLSTEYESYYA